jgi:hypothetical protein
MGHCKSLNYGRFCGRYRSDRLRVSAVPRPLPARPCHPCLPA